MEPIEPWMVWYVVFAAFYAGYVLGICVEVIHQKRKAN